jgi:hypothetical protein
MKLKSISLLLILACTTLLASPRKLPCPGREAAASIIKTGTVAVADDSDLLPMHRLSMIAL